MGRDLVVGDIHGHFATLRRALAELELGEHYRVFSLGDLVDRGPDPWAAKSWIAGPHASGRFHLTIRGNPEQMMFAGLAVGPRKSARRSAPRAQSRPGEPVPTRAPADLTAPIAVSAV